jgi:DNA primase
MAPLSSVQRKSLERATLQYSQHLGEAEDYLQGRGIGPEVARSVALGVVRDPLPGHEYLEGRLAIPYLTDSGPVNMTFRCLKDHKCSNEGHSKYMLWAGLSANLYSVQSIARAGDWIAVAEGELDALSANIAGIPCVGISGAEKWQDHWSAIFEDFVRVYVLEDGDDAGQKFGTVLVRETGAIRVPMPSGEDVNSMLVQHGAAYLKGRIRA